MKDLKTTTHDESLMFVYKDFGTSSCTIKKFTRNMKLLHGHLNKTQELSKKCPRRFFLKRVFFEQKKKEAKTYL